LRDHRNRRCLIPGQLGVIIQFLGDVAMATKKKRISRRAAKKRPGRKRVPTKRTMPKRRSPATRRGATGRQSTRKKRASKKSPAIRRKERKVEDARHQLIEAEKELAVEELPKLVHPATKRRGADSHVPSRNKRKRPKNPKEQKLEQGLEESMAGSDPVSVTQPAMPIAEKPQDRAEPRDDDSETDTSRT
jgi:hypothetical protein